MRDIKDIPLDKLVSFCYYDSTFGNYELEGIVRCKDGIEIVPCLIHRYSNGRIVERRIDFARMIGWEDIESVEEG